MSTPQYIREIKRFPRTFRETTPLDPTPPERNLKVSKLVVGKLIVFGTNYAKTCICLQKLVLFRTDDDTPCYISPQLDPAERTIFLVFNPIGSGHYDAAVPFNSLQHETPQPPTKCSCGVNTDIKSCCPMPRYSSRCPCLKNGKECTSLCRCKNCVNPKGPKLKAESGGHIHYKCKYPLIEVKNCPRAAGLGWKQ